MSNYLRTLSIFFSEKKENEKKDKEKNHIYRKRKRRKM